MKKSFLQTFAGIALCIAFTINPFSLVAQTAKENLEKSVEMYNALREFQSKLNYKTFSESEVEIVKNRVSKGKALLDKVIADGNAEQIRAARYFKANFSYELGFLLGAKGEINKAFDIFKEIENDFIAYQPSSFPIKYVYFDKNYSIAWENFSPTQAEYYTGFGELSFNTEKYAEAAKMTKLGLEHPSTSSWLKYVGTNKLIDIYNKKNDLLTPDEYYNAAISSMKLYDILTEENKKNVADYKYPTWERGYKIMSAALTNDIDKSEKMTKRYGETAIFLKSINQNEKSIPFFNKSIQRNWGTSSDFQAGLAVAKSQNNSPLGLLCLGKLAPNVSDCETMKQIANDYNFFGDKLQSKTYQDKASQCLIAKAEKEAKEEKERKRREAQYRKEQHSKEHPFNVFISADLYPLFTKVENMDFGGFIDFRGRKVAHSFGYALVKQKKDYGSKSNLWDGYKASYAIKIFAHNNDYSYSGLFFAYAYKTFNPINASISPTDNSGSFMQKNVTPVDKQIEMMWNSGIQSLGRGVGFEMYYGIGASYNTLSYKEADIKTNTFSGNSFFDARKNEHYWALKMRLGVTFGLNLGRKR